MKAQIPPTIPPMRAPLVLLLLLLLLLVGLGFGYAMVIVGKAMLGYGKLYKSDVEVPRMERRLERLGMSVALARMDMI
jgi:hypothetical protein